MSHHHNEAELVQQLLKEGKLADLRHVIGRMDPADTADLLEELEAEERDVVFDLLDKETASDVLVELESSFLDDVVEDMSSDELADLADNMAPDDAVRFLGEFDARQSAQILAGMEDSREVSELLRYPEDSAGSIMTTEFYSLPGTTSVHEAREALVPLEMTDPVFYVYVIDPASEKLLGVVSLTHLFTAKPGLQLASIAEPDFVFCHPHDDQEEVARNFRKYDLWVIPVLDLNHRLVGRITADDIMDVLIEESDEDLAHLVGAPDIEAEENSPVSIARLRLPWLMITMCAGLLNSILIKTILDVTDIVAIAIFVPAIMAMGGNTGIQASAIAVRGIALGYKAYARLYQIISREILVGIILGLTCGLLSFAIVYGVLTVTGADTGLVSVLQLSVTVAWAMCNAMVFASCFGSIVPVILHRWGVDPALASGPFVTTSTDLSASLIYFLTCLLLLR